MSVLAWAKSVEPPNQKPAGQPVAYGDSRARLSPVPELALERLARVNQRRRKTHGFYRYLGRVTA